uniref:Late embryogenisis abundant protein 13 n=1 Tax=Betula platyphylla TaxID=78630 RepID=A0A223FWK7_BETPL|nr:late embryogenisis abundant protein 13 [Betula platyphylla]
MHSYPFQKPPDLPTLASSAEGRRHSPASSTHKAPSMIMISLRSHAPKDFLDNRWVYTKNQSPIKVILCKPFPFAWSPKSEKDYKTWSKLNQHVSQRQYSSSCNLPRVAVCVGICGCWGENGMDNARESMNVAAGDAKEKAEEAKQGAAEAMQHAKDKTESWADWAYDTFTEGFGIGKDNPREAAQNVVGKAGHAASTATKTMNSAASDTSKLASEKAGDAVHKAYGKAGDAKNFAYEKGDETIRMATDKAGDAKETMDMARETASNRANDAKEGMAGSMGQGKDKVVNAYDEAKEKINVGSNYASDKAGDLYEEAKQKLNVASDDAEERMGSGKDKAANAYEKAKHHVEDSYNSAKETMTEQAKINYEAAKEKASQATGDLGAKMRHHSVEL